MAEIVEIKIKEIEMAIGDNSNPLVFRLSGRELLELPVRVIPAALDDE